MTFAAVVERATSPTGVFPLGFVRLLADMDDQSGTVCCVVVAILLFLVWLCYAAIKWGDSEPWTIGRYDGYGGYGVARQYGKPLIKAVRDDEIIPTDANDLALLESMQGCTMSSVTLPSGLTIPKAREGYKWLVVGKKIVEVEDEIV